MGAITCLLDQHVQVLRDFRSETYTKNLSVSLQTKQRQFLYSATDTLLNSKGIVVDLRFHTG